MAGEGADILYPVIARRVRCAMCDVIFGMRRLQKNEPVFCSYPCSVAWHQEHAPKQVTNRYTTGETA